MMTKAARVLGHQVKFYVARRDRPPCPVAWRGTRKATYWRKVVRLVGVRGCQKRVSFFCVAVTGVIVAAPSSRTRLVLFPMVRFLGLCCYTTAVYFFGCAETTESRSKHTRLLHFSVYCLTSVSKPCRTSGPCVLQPLAPPPPGILFPPVIFYFPHGVLLVASQSL